jgi:hypothetical protein
MRRSIVLLTTLILLGACTGVPTLGPAPVGPTVTVDPNATASPTPFGPQADAPTAAATLPAPSPSPSATFTIQPTAAFTPVPQTTYVPARYTLSAMLDYIGHSLSVDETIVYTNSTGEILQTLVLAVEPNLWKNCFVPGSITVDGGAVKDVELSGDRLEVPLAIPSFPNTSQTLFIHYDLHLPEADTYHVFGFNARQVNLVDWYPFIVPYAAGQGWVLHAPTNVGEHLVYDAAVFDMTLHLTDANLPVTIAASAPAERVSYGWHYHLEGVRSFAVSASTDYQTVSDTAGGVTITSYFFTGQDLQGQAALENTVKAVKTYSGFFGPDPYPSLSVVETPFFDGMEYDGLYFLSQDFYAAYDGTVLNNLVDIAAHETAHQWWFGSVGNDQALEPWLDEALATYSERLFYERNYPDVTAWETFRVDGFGPSGWVDTDIYHGVNFRTYANAVYLRGEQFLQALRLRIGDQAFFAFLLDYATQMAGKRATAADFFRILREHTSADLSDLLGVYFQNKH